MRRFPKTYVYAYKGEPIEFAVDPYDGEVYVVAESMAKACGYPVSQNIHRLCVGDVTLKHPLRPGIKDMRMVLLVDLYSIQKRTRSKKIYDLAVWCESLIPVVAREHCRASQIKALRARVNGLINQLRTKEVA